MFRPRFFLRSDSQLLLDSLCEELAHSSALLGSHGLRSAEEKIRNFESCLHWPILPYLWEMQFNLRKSKAQVRDLTVVEH
jgi:hypothetical protein